MILYYGLAQPLPIYVYGIGIGALAMLAGCLVWRLTGRKLKWYVPLVIALVGAFGGGVPVWDQLRVGKLAASAGGLTVTRGAVTQVWHIATRTRDMSTNSLRYKTPKVFHVSPFMSLDHEYQWTFTPPTEKLVIHMSMHAPQSPFFDATLSLNRQPWSAPALRSALIRHPWMTAKVIAAIHWEALRLLIKRVPVFDHP